MKEVTNFRAMESDEDCRSYWSPEIGSRESYAVGISKMWVELVQEVQKPVWMERSFKIWPEGFENMVCILTQFYY